MNVAIGNRGLCINGRGLVRAVAEGLALQCRWQYDAIRRKVPARGPLRFVGGGARSGSIGAMIADATGELVEVPKDPQNSGALGAAMLCAAGLGLASTIEDAASLVPVERTIEPKPGNRGVYDEHYRVLKRLYYSNKRSFKALNEVEAPEASRNGRE